MDPSFEANNKGTDFPIPREVCDAVFHQLHDDLRRQLNFHSIYPLLNFHHLLDPSLDQSILTCPTITIEKQVDTIISWLPRSTQADYLTPFMECLLETVEAGDAHKELAEKMKVLCEGELLKLRLNANNGDLNSFGDNSSESDDERDTTTRSEETETFIRGCNSIVSPKTKRRLIIKGCKICSVIFLMTSTAWIICTVLFVKVIPKDLNKREMMIYGEATFPLASNTEWLESMTVILQDENCGGTVAVINGVSCSDLPVVISKMGFSSDQHSPHDNALPGSEINITFSKNFSSNKVLPYIWITETREADLNLDQMTQESSLRVFSSKHCDDNIIEGAKCYKTKSRGNVPIHYTVTTAGYIDTLQTKPDYDTDNVGIEWSYKFLAYNFTDIMCRYKPTIQHVNSRNKAFHIQISHAFNFVDTCTLINLQNYAIDTGNEDCSIKISDLKRRWDITVLILIVYFLCVTLTVTFVITSVVLCLKRDKHRNSAIL